MVSCAFRFSSSYPSSLPIGTSVGFSGGGETTGGLWGSEPGAMGPGPGAGCCALAATPTRSNRRQRSEPKPQGDLGTRVATLARRPHSRERVAAVAARIFPVPGSGVWCSLCRMGASGTQTPSRSQTARALVVPGPAGLRTRLPEATDVIPFPSPSIHPSLRQVISQRKHSALSDQLFSPSACSQIRPISLSTVRTGGRGICQSHWTRRRKPGITWL